MSARRPFILRKERTFGQKIEGTFEFIRLTLKPLFKSLLFYTSPFVLVGMFLVSYLLNALISLGVNSNSGVLPDEEEVLMLGLSLFGFMFLMVFAGTMIMSVVYSVIRVYEEKGDGDFTHRDVWARLKKIYWPLLGTLFLYGIVFFVVYLIILIPLTLVLAVLSFLALPIVYMVVGFFMIIMFTAIGAQVFERKSMGKALSHAFKLLKRSWWPSIGLFIVLMLIYNAVTLIFSAPFYVNFFIQTLNTVEVDFMAEPSLLEQLLSHLLAAILLLGTFFSYSVPLVGMNLQYFHLSEVSDAKSLIQRIDQLGVKTEEEEEDY